MALLISLEILYISKTDRGSVFEVLHFAF